MSNEDVVAKNKKTLKVFGWIVAIGLFIIVAAALSDGSESTDQNNNASASKSETVDEKQAIVNKVEKALNEFDDDYKTSLVSTRYGGLQGDIEGVEPYSKDTVKVKVSTNYSDNDDGKEIARKLFTNICIDVPELNSLYVTSTTSGLDSPSVYRSDYPGCKL